MKMKKQTNNRIEIELTENEKASFWEEYENTGCVASCEYVTIENDQKEIVCYAVFYKDYIHRKQFTGHYKTQSIAHREATKFLYRIHF